MNNAENAKSAKHTPGPWQFRVYAGGCTIVSAHNAPGRSVRDWLKGVSVKVDASIRDDQSDAHLASPDARLIGAAPELLEALENCVVKISALTGDCDATLGPARAALTLAKGPA